jgi:hypothetical protein
MRHDRESLNRFATAYVEFRRAVNDSEIVSWVIALDQSERTDGTSGTSYRRYFAGSLDVNVSNRDRAEAARLAVDYHDRKGREIMDDFDRRNAAMDQKSLALVEAANAIPNEGYKLQAVALATSARKNQHTLEALRENYVSTYDLQVELLNAIAKQDGNLGRVFKLMQEKLPDKQRLEAEGEKLRKDEQGSLQQLQEQYAAFKGLTGVTLDYVEPHAPDPHNTASQ